MKSNIQCIYNNNIYFKINYNGSIISNNRNRNSNSNSNSNNYIINNMKSNSNKMNICIFL